MSCPQCRIFFGHPCGVCRTAGRVVGLCKKLSPLQEGPALSALRDCAGILSDLVELAEVDPLLPAVPTPVPIPTSGVPRPEACDGGNPEKPAEGGDKPKEDAEKEKPKEEAEKDKKPSTKEKKKKVKVKDKESKPGKEKKKKEAEAEEKKKEAEAEENPASSASTRRVEAGDTALSASEEEERRLQAEAEEDRQRAVDKRVTDNPAEHGLTKVTVRGSAGKHFEEDIRVFAPAGSGGVPEPANPPRRNTRENYDEESRRRERSRSGGPKWKGYKHFLRGRDHWTQFKKSRKK